MNFTDFYTFFHTFFHTFFLIFLKQNRDLSTTNPNDTVFCYDAIYFLMKNDLPQPHSTIVSAFNFRGV